MKHIAGLADVNASFPKGNGFLLDGNGRQIKVGPSTLPQKMAGQIVLVQALHNRDNSARLLSIQPRDQSPSIPIDDSLPGGFRQGVVRIERIVDDDEIGAAT